MLTTRTRTIMTTLAASAAFASAAVAPAISQADKVATKTPAVTCPGGVAGSPGDIRETTVTTKSADGSSVKETSKEICGSDGKWHTVATLETTGKSTRPLPGAIAVGSPVTISAPALRKVTPVVRSLG